MDRAKELADWDRKLTILLGTTVGKALTVHSFDEIIGIFRELDTGEDPFKSERMSREEMLADPESEAVQTLRASRRDEIDEQVWKTWRGGGYGFPPHLRPPASEYRDI